MKKYVVLFTVLLMVFCGGQKNNAPSTQDEDAHEHGQEGQVHEEDETPASPELQAEEHEEDEHQDVQVSLEKQKDWGIKVGSAVLDDIISRISLPGVLVLNQNRTAHISSFVAGKVTALSVDLGTKVRQGQSVCTINSPEFAQAQADFLETRARLNLSQKNFERAQKLYAEKALEEKEFLRREAEYEKLITEYGARGSTLHSYGLTHEHIDALISKCDAIKHEEYMCEIADPNLPLLSPLSGTVVFRDIILGEHVNPEKIVLTVSNLNTLWALLDAYEKDLPFINKNSAVAIESPLYPGRTFEGKITYISNLMDEQLRTVKIRVEVNNAEGLLKPNMYIQGIVKNNSETKNTLVIPDEAVQNLEGEKVVFILEEEDVFTVRHVSLGLKIGSLRVITGGLTATDKLAIKGAFYLKTELTKATFGQAHVH
jgi:cobalt-zinc-cadmium efflux system membrane fusion protein